jgi:predicted nucleotidyltransferase
MRKRSSGSVAVWSRDRTEVENSVRELAAKLRREHPEIQRILWFGSWVTGRPVPASDCDLCVVLESSDKPFRDRIPDYLPDRFPLDLDIFPYTREEFDRLAVDLPGWHRQIASGWEI